MKGEIEYHTCPGRRQEGPWDASAACVDRWEWRGDDRVCSFCGSLHPNDFESLLWRVLYDEQVLIFPADHANKIYLQRPEVSDASQGALKYKKWHNLSAEWVARINPRFHEALEISLQRFQRRFDQKGV